MIRKALQEDIPRLKKITEACAKHMIAQGIFQWNEHYPSLAVFRNDIAQENMYVYELNETIVGCVMLSFEKDAFYDSIAWLTPEKKTPLYSSTRSSSRLSRQRNCKKNNGLRRSLCPSKRLFICTLRYL